MHLFMWVTHNKDDKLNLKFQKDFVKEGQRAQDGHTQKSSLHFKRFFIQVGGLLIHT